MAFIFHKIKIPEIEGLSHSSKRESATKTGSKFNDFIIINECNKRMQYTNHSITYLQNI